MGGNGEGKKWIIIIWIWISTRVDLSIPSLVAGLVARGCQGREKGDTVWFFLLNASVFLK
jgi:hypothetical protein